MAALFQYAASLTADAPRRYNETMITKVTEENLMQAAAVHAEAWRASHASFCSPEFVAAHTAQRQAEYIRGEMAKGKVFWLLADGAPVGVVSVCGSLIENLYVLPAAQGKGYGTRLLRYAQEQCAGVPALWVLSTNERAQRLYLREGFRFTGERKALSASLSELQMTKGSRV